MSQETFTGITLLFTSRKRAEEAAFWIAPDDLIDSSPYHKHLTIKADRVQGVFVQLHREGVKSFEVQLY